MTAETPAPAENGAAPKLPSSSPFDIVAEYNRVLAADPDLTKPLAAIEALIELLRQHPTTTIQETVEMIKAGAETLKCSVANPIPLGAGTDLFQEYILRSTRPPEPKGNNGTGGGGGGGSRRGKASSTSDYVHQDFDDVRQHLLRNTSLFALRAKDARAKIASTGARYVLDGCTVLTHGGSRTVGALLLKAAKDRQTQGLMFKVIHVQSSLLKSEGEAMVSQLRKLGVPVATITMDSICHVLPSVSRVFLGAETVCKNGGIISRLGTFPVATLAKQFKIPVWVAAETHKMAKVFPLSQFDLKVVKQDVVSFKVEEDLVEDKGVQMNSVTEFDRVRMVDYTPPHLITNLITEAGIKLPSSVFEFLLNIYP